MQDKKFIQKRGKGPSIKSQHHAHFSPSVALPRETLLRQHIPSQASNKYSIPPKRSALITPDTTHYPDVSRRDSRPGCRGGTKRIHTLSVVGLPGDSGGKGQTLSKLWRSKLVVLLLRVFIDFRSPPEVTILTPSRFSALIFAITFVIFGFWFMHVMETVFIV